MTFTALASSSKGNAYLVEDGHTTLLLECGVAFRTLQKLCGFRLTDRIDACLISHEHKDHSRCALEIEKRGIPVYTGYGTAEALDLEDAHIIEAGRQVEIGTFGVLPFATFHDAAEPLGFCIRSRIDGETIAFATDTCNLGYRFPGVNLLALEANYDPEILDRCEHIPEKVKKRITYSHMAIGRLCDYLRSLDLSGCTDIYLLHLSDATSHEARFVDRVRRAVPTGIQIHACGRG